MRHHPGTAIMPAICPHCSRPLRVREWELGSCPGCGARLVEPPAHLHDSVPLPDPRAALPMSKLAVLSFFCALCSVAASISVAADPSSIFALAYLPMFGAAVIAGIAGWLCITRGQRLRGEKWAERAICIAIGWFLLMWVMISLGHSRNINYSLAHDSCQQLAKAMQQFADD